MHPTAAMATPDVTRPKGPPPSISAPGGNVLRSLQPETLYEADDLREDARAAERHEVAPGEPGEARLRPVGPEPDGVLGGHDTVAAGRADQEPLGRETGTVRERGGHAVDGAELVAAERRSRRVAVEAARRHETVGEIAEAHRRDDRDGEGQVIEQPGGERGEVAAETQPH